MQNLPPDRSLVGKSIE